MKPQLGPLEYGQSQARYSELLPVPCAASSSSTGGASATNHESLSTKTTVRQRRSAAAIPGSLQ